MMAIGPSRARKKELWSRGPWGLRPKVYPVIITLDRRPWRKIEDTTSEIVCDMPFILKIIPYGHRIRKWEKGVLPNEHIACLQKR
jgi:hypothetical protein